MRERVYINAVIGSSAEAPSRNPGGSHSLFKPLAAGPDPIDPFSAFGCNSHEAALMGRNIAPGIQRRFVAEEWPQLGKKIWQEARAEAKALEIDNPGFRLLMGSDIDPQVIKIARHHAKKAGVDQCIRLQTAPFEDFQSSRKYVCLFTNPPWGKWIEIRAIV